MAHNKNWYYHQHQGVEVTKDFTAEIGLEFGADTELSFYLDSEAYRDFTVSDEGIEGDEIEPGTAPAAISVIFLDPLSNTDVLDSSFTPRPNYNVGDHIRVAIYMTDTETETSTSYTYPRILFYDSNHNTFLDTYYNSSNQLITNLNINNTTKLNIQGLNSGGTITPQDYRISYVTGTSYYGINARWVSNNLFFGLKFATNIPIFDTEAHAQAYLRDPSETTGLLNRSDEDPEEQYNEQFDYWFIYSNVGHNTRNVLASNNEKHYLRWPKGENDKICFLVHPPTQSQPWKLELNYYVGMDAYASESEDGEYFPTHSIPTRYLDRSISFGMDDYYTQFGWYSNIPRADSIEQMEDYFNGVIDISQMSNFKEIARIDASIVDPNFPGTDVDEVTSLGTNGMQYGYGCRLYAISNLQLAALFNELFDPLNLEDILDGQKIFGADGICQSIAGILYLPLSDLSAICGLGSLSNIKIGSWQSQNAQGQRINNNSGVIDVGTFTMTPTFEDFRDFEPYTKLFIATGYWGFHELQISKYYNKSVNCKVAIDCTTGATSLMLFADGIMLDCFEGTCGASRPFVATDNNAYMNNIINAISGASATGASGAQNVAGAVGDVGKLSQAGAASGAAGVAGVAVAAGGVAVTGIFAGYNIKNAVDSPPQMSRGSLSGNLSYYASNKINFIIAQKRCVVPENRQSVIGMPSGHGGTVGTFSGFLACSAFKLGDGFTGTDAERAHIYEIMSKGIYL